MKQKTDNKKNANDAVLAARDLVKHDFVAVDNIIRTELKSSVERINEIVEHLIQSGGKRLRPLMLLLLARNAGYEKGSEHQELAAIIEFIHTSTLLHDDVVDESSKRRNSETANAVWGNAASVLAGDFLYSRAFQILARRSNIPVMKALADATNQMSEGEVMQMVNCHQGELGEADYFEVIRRKTAELYAAACKIAAIVAQPEHTSFHDIAFQYGLNFGMTFQIIDDLLDYTADKTIVGKNIGDDLAEGKMTLPLIYALQQGNQQEQALIRQAIKSGGREAIESVTAAIQRSQAYDKTFQKAKEYSQQAQKLLQQFPENPYRDALVDITESALLRTC